MKTAYAIALLFICSITLKSAQETKVQEVKKEETKPIPEPKEFVTTHQGTFGGKLIKYKAIAGETYMKNKEGEPVASIW